MAGLKIQVNGSGLIPRGYGIAPRKDPFVVTDVKFINLILNTRGLSVRFINPVTSQWEDLTKKNLMKNWSKYANYDLSTVNVKPIAEPPQAAPAEEIPDGVPTPAEPASQEAPKSDEIVIPDKINPVEPPVENVSEDPSAELQPTTDVTPAEEIPDGVPTPAEPASQEAPKSDNSGNNGKGNGNGNKYNNNSKNGNKR